jgi:hypothetical protein
VLDLNGTPYWGNESFSDIRSLDRLQTKPISTSEITDLCNSKGISVAVTDMYSLFLALAHLDFLFVIEDEGTLVTWCRDVRFNYRDRFIFVPYYKYETAEYILSNHFKDMSKIDLIEEDIANVRHNFELCSFILDDRRTGSRVDSIMLYDYENKVKYTLSIKDVPYFSGSEFSLLDLYDRYINSAYMASDLRDFYWEKYTRIDNKYKNNREHILRKRLELKAYSENYKEIAYTDVRQYTYEELKESSLVPDNEISYWLRILEFEAYLYCVFAAGVTVSEEYYKGEFDMLGKTLRFLPCSKNGKCLVLKHYYKDDIRMRVKSYERYRRN